MENKFLKIKLPVLIFREGKYFIAYTPALDLSTSGKTYQQVKKRFNEVVNIFLEEIIEKGTFEEVLQELGWKKFRKEWIPPYVVAHENEEITVSSPAK